MSYHSPIQSSSSNRKVLGSGSSARMSMATHMSGNMSKTVDPAGIEKPVKPTISMGELGLATEAEKNRKGYLSTYLEGQTPYNKLSSFLGGKKI